MPGSPGAYGSIWPAVQNLLLAARGVGLGAVLTGLFGGPSLDATKKVLGIPDEVEPVAFIPLGYPDKERYGPDDPAAAVRGAALGALGGGQGEHGQDAVPPLRPSH